MEESLAPVEQGLYCCDRKEHADEEEGSIY